MTDQAGGPTRFIVDAMLGSLARKLRAFGFDTLYFREGTDRELLELAAAEGRVLVTSDRALGKTAAARRIPSLAVAGGEEGSRLASLRRAAKAGGIRLLSGSPRCSICNGRLDRLMPYDVKGHVPATVAGRHRLFFRCTSCGRYYWRGGHWKKLRLLERRLGQHPYADVSRRRSRGGRPGEEGLGGAREGRAAAQG